MALSSSSAANSVASEEQPATSAASSPPPDSPPPDDVGPSDEETSAEDFSDSDVSSDLDFDEDALFEEEGRARIENDAAEQKRKKATAKNRGRKKAPTTQAERAAKAEELETLLMKSAAFSEILTQKTKVLGRVGSSLDGKALGEHNLELAEQPKLMTGGTMRDYQLEGLTWMYEICCQGMSGILADEMGLGKTVQAISLIALLREKEDYLGPHLIVAPLSTLSNWMDEFHQWCPKIPVVMYHGLKEQREEIFKTKMMKHLPGGRPTAKFPVVCTSYEMVLRDQENLSQINWEFIIIDEGHRMKNAEAKLFKQLCEFKSATRLLITGTPLQNNLKELWSLLHFLLPNLFMEWEAFDSWFDFSGLEDEKATEEFIEDRKKQDIVKKMHLILQPMLLRRIKQDVAAYLPKKREYVLFAPMTKEQTDLYNAISNKGVDTRSFLENLVTSQITSTVSSRHPSRQPSRASSINSTPKSNGSAGELMSLPVRESPKKKPVDTTASAAPNAFSLMMGKRGLGRPRKDATPAPSQNAISPDRSASKRKNPPTSIEPDSKMAKSSRQSTPVRTRGRPLKTKTYRDVDSDEEKLPDDEFEKKLANEIASETATEEGVGSSEELLPHDEMERAQTLELAKKQIAQKKLGNPMVQLRLICNTPHNFYNPWLTSGLPVDESIITSSGKMLLLDRLLSELFRGDHKVLIFSQFKTQLDILEDYCELRDWKVCRIDGGVSQSDRRTQIREFNTNPEYKIFLLSTRAGGQGINLAAADTVVLFDSDFNPQQDLQAQDRCHRIGQTRPVIVYRLATKSTVEETLLHNADAKRRLEKLVIKKGGFKTIRQKMNPGGDFDIESLWEILLKDGQVYQVSGGEDILSKEDLKVLCDRSDDAYSKAERGEGDADRYRVVETGANSIKMARKN